MIAYIIDCTARIMSELIEIIMEHDGKERIEDVNQEDWDELFCLWSNEGGAVYCAILEELENHSKKVRNKMLSIIGNSFEREMNNIFDNIIYSEHMSIAGY